MAAFCRTAEIIAHRGASAYAAEHSLAAYDLALELGADRLELDVRALADGTPVVVHDRTLARTCGDPRAVRDVLPADLEALDPGTRPLPLELVLQRYGRRARLLVELKEPRAGDVRRVLGLVTTMGLGGGVALQSFDHGAMRLARRLDPAIAVAPLYAAPIPGMVIRAGLGRTARWATAVACCARSVDATLVAAAASHGLAVHAYTVNDEREMRRLLGAGVDALITDVPDRARLTLATAPAVAA